MTEVDNFQGTNDPLAEETQGTQAAPETDAAPAQSQEPTPAPEGIPGTPFKDVDGLVKSYKELQRLQSARDQELKHTRAQLTQLAQMLMQRQQQPQPQEKPAEDFWKAFAENPTAVLQELMDRQLRGQFDQRLGPIQQELGAYKLNAEVDGWIKQHPEFTSQDEEALVEIMASNPQLKSLPNRLDVAWDMLLAKRYRESQQQTAVAGAKQVAGLGGKQASLAPQAPKDAFDELLDMDKAEREVFSFRK